MRFGMMSRSLTLTGLTVMLALGLTAPVDAQHRDRGDAYRGGYAPRGDWHDGRGTGTTGVIAIQAHSSAARCWTRCRRIAGRRARNTSAGRLRAATLLLRAPARLCLSLRATSAGLLLRSMIEPECDAKMSGTSLGSPTQRQ